MGKYQCGLQFEFYQTVNFVDGPGQRTLHLLHNGHWTDDWSLTGLYSTKKYIKTITLVNIIGENNY